MIRERGRTSRRGHFRSPTSKFSFDRVLPAPSQMPAALSWARRSDCQWAHPLSWASRVRTLRMSLSPGFLSIVRLAAALWTHSSQFMAGWLAGNPTQHAVARSAYVQVATALAEMAMARVQTEIL